MREPMGARARPGCVACGGVREGARDERARRTASRCANEPQRDAECQMQDRMGSANSRNSRAAAGVLGRASARPRMRAARRGARPNGVEPARRPDTIAARRAIDDRPRAGPRIGRDAARADALRRTGPFAAHAAGSTVFTAPRCLDEARRQISLCAATELSRHAIVLIVRNDNGNRARTTTKKCRMSSDRNIARMACRASTHRNTGAFLDFDCHTEFDMPMKRANSNSMASKPTGTMTARAIDFATRPI
ncbi:hypothetical protein [Burkholderia oklahomensis]|uniref:hypothetical protein n=1 Tax=Burkholderia oklahomensis TaxID=342113 RepID=UPI001E539C08|nr:hypothetical protein [Burkholderia oklahomensis]